MASDYSDGVIHGLGGGARRTSRHSKAGARGSGAWDAERDILGWAKDHGLEQAKAAVCSVRAARVDCRVGRCRHRDAKDLDGGDKSVDVVTVLARQNLGGEGGLGCRLG
ncbi:hypothetical protein COCC4DRAFT_22698 [Bipolaris maydis ATCC 48331]|uniref:Uncharacterized protein n=1 Tax=Cochliobolus heterostrophus (strain C4 / ATCC 48331 / race T) TaxID=665024 RepID=N4X451_COCH4|nr:uncharacterized protein COCC4DRAFT_22698 [Bipolaris maydis ATCC 48331]ENI06435.1 hypothetical protein COCC4DRAFT_22698 [Bipolaris maydis ATCC 48331]